MIVQSSVTDGGRNRNRTTIIDVDVGFERETRND